MPLRGITAAEMIAILHIRPQRPDIRAAARHPAFAAAPAPKDMATLRAWVLALLRFAVTLENADRLVALAAAAELDRVGSDASTFRYFTRASVCVCAAIADPGPPASAATLQHHLACIDDPRLQRAFAAALDIRIEKKRAAKAAKAVDLWKGLGR